MDYFNARISRATAGLLQTMIDNYAKQRGIIVTKGNALTFAYDDAQWVPVDQWDKIRDYEIPEAAIDDSDMSDSATKLKIPLSQEVRDGILQMQRTLPAYLGSHRILTGAIVSYLLKAAYIRFVLNDFQNDRQQFPEGSIQAIAQATRQQIIATQQASPADVAFQKAQAELQALIGIDQAPIIAAVLKRLRDAVDPH